MIGTRGARGRIVSTNVCGRRHCRVCRRWRHACTDFGVKVWDDKEKTRPRYLKSECHECLVRIGRRRMSTPRIREAKRQYDRLRYHERKLARLCTWCGTNERHGRSSICASCDSDAYGWVNIGGSLVEESELASFNFDHGMSGVSRSSPLGLALHP